MKDTLKAPKYNSGDLIRILRLYTFGRGYIRGTEIKPHDKAYRLIGEIRKIQYSSYSEEEQEWMYTISTKDDEDTVGRWCVFENDLELQFTI